MECLSKVKKVFAFTLTKIQENKCAQSYTHNIYQQRCKFEKLMVILEKRKPVNCSQLCSHKRGLEVFFKYHWVWGAIRAGVAFVFTI